MKKILATALVALLAACGGSDDELSPLVYGGAQAPTYTEEATAASAQAALDPSLLFPASPSTDPAYGAPGLADQLAAQLGAYGATLSKDAPLAKLGAPAGLQAMDTSGMDPACVTATATSVTWSNCRFDTVEFDPMFGEVTMHVTIGGTLSFSSETGRTSWNVRQAQSVSMSLDGLPLTMNGTVDLVGDLTVSDTTIVGESRSTVATRGSYMQFPLDQAVTTTLTVDLGYQGAPFCVTSGDLVLEQRWLQRPYGATPVDLPDLGWRFAWTGCNQLTVAHSGS